ncbi:hypothetical protein BH10ACI1_BH10ACI1_21080 [soil metagenome]
MKIRFLLIFLPVLFFINCAKPSETVNQNKAETPKLEITELTNKKNESDVKQVVISIKGIKGLIVLSDKYEKSDEFIRFYNEDGSLWYQFSFFYDDRDGKFEYENNNFNPFAFNPDYSRLALKLAGENATYFEVIVNEETNLKKYVKKDDKNFKFETWENHILQTFAIEFNNEVNPLREIPNGKIKNIETANIEKFAPVEIKGEWLKVKWDVKPNSTETTPKTDSGWIQWKKADTLLIDWLYTS